MITEVEIKRIDCSAELVPTPQDAASDQAHRSFHAKYKKLPGRVSQGSWVRYPVWQHTFVSPSAFSRRAVVSYWRKYVHEVLVNRLGGPSLPRKSVVRLTDRPDMTLDVYRGRKTKIQQQEQQKTNYKYQLEIHLKWNWTPP